MQIARHQGQDFHDTLMGEAPECHLVLTVFTVKEQKN